MKKDQFEYAEIIQESGVNIVTCGMCGKVLLHGTEESEIECPFCGYESEPCDFPDYIHNTPNIPEPRFSSYEDKLFEP